MTDEELDILASSYLDGEATPEEVALVERDPSLMARVQLLRTAQSAVRATVAVPLSLKEQQLSAALAAFGGGDRRASLSLIESDESSIDLTADESVPLIPVGVGAESIDGDDSVIDLRSRRSERRPNSRMRWVSAAAGFLVFGFGAVFLATQMNSADDTAEVAVAADAGGESDDAADALEESADLADSDTSAAGSAVVADGATADDATAESTAPLESEEMSADAEEDLTSADGDETAATAEEDAAEESSTDDDGAGLNEPPIIRDGLPESGFFPDEPVVSYSDVPTSDEIVANLDLRWRDPESSGCATSAPVPEGTEIFAYLPVEVTQPDGTTAQVEALYVAVGAGYEVILVNPDTCELF